MALQVTNASYRWHQPMMPKIVNKSHNPHVLKTTPAKQKQRRPWESISVVPTKNSLKVKLENFSQL